jgi:hypothetical protein
MRRNVWPTRRVHGGANTIDELGWNFLIVDNCSEYEPWLFDLTGRDRIKGGCDLRHENRWAETLRERGR